MKRLILILLLIIAWMPEFAKSENSKPRFDLPYWASVGFLAAGTFADWKSSAPTPGTREKNPYMSGTRGQQAILMGTTGGLTFLMGYALRRSGHPKAALSINIISGGIHGACAGLNYRF